MLEAGALFEGKAFFALVGLGIGEIKLGVGNVEIAAENDGLGEFEELAVLEEGRVPVVAAQGDAAEVFFGVGGVDGDEIELLVFGCEHAALGVGVAVGVVGHVVPQLNVFGQAVAGGDGLGFGQNSRAGIALFLGRVDVGVVFGQAWVDFFGLGFSFLEAKDVGLLGLDEWFEGVLANDCADAVDVPGVDLHGISLA